MRPRRTAKNAAETRDRDYGWDARPRDGWAENRLRDQHQPRAYRDTVTTDGGGRIGSLPKEREKAKPQTSERMKAADGRQWPDRRSVIRLAERPRNWGRKMAPNRVGRCIGAAKHVERWSKSDRGPERLDQWAGRTETFGRQRMEPTGQWRRFG